MTKLLLIAGGGAAGSVLRYLVAGWGQRLAAGVLPGFPTFPLGTLLVNVAGCLGIGLLGGLLSGPALLREEYRLALLVGLFGGFTTFSTFGWETLGLAGDGEWAPALWNVLLHNALGLAAVWLGARLAARWMAL